MERFEQLCREKGVAMSRAVSDIGLSKSAVTKWKDHSSLPNSKQLVALAKYFNVTLDYMLGNSDYTPSVTESIIIPVIGEIGASYDRIINQDFDFEKMEVPASALKGRPVTDFIGLKVKGDSMFPTYQDGDFVLIKKQDTMEYSGRIGAIIINDDEATLKRIEYVPNENWIKLIPINPSFPPKLIKGEDVAHCRVIGIPVWMCREL